MLQMSAPYSGLLASLIKTYLAYSYLSFFLFGRLQLGITSPLCYLTIIPRARMGSDSLRPHGLLTQRP